MSSSDYTSAIGGGLKLKGAKDAGIERKKKKKKKKPRRRSPPLEGSDEIAKVTDPEDRTSAVQKALADEDDDDNDEVDDVTQIEKEEDKEVDKLKDFGKTEAQRRHEERRRKRVCPIHTSPTSPPTSLQFPCWEVC